eukprot:1242432-Rhodomonas_salina.4
MPGTEIDYAATRPVYGVSQSAWRGTYFAPQSSQVKKPTSLCPSYTVPGTDAAYGAITACQFGTQDCVGPTATHAGCYKPEVVARA